MVSCAIALEVELHFVEGVADLVERGLWIEVLVAGFFAKSLQLSCKYHFFFFIFAAEIINNWLMEAAEEARESNRVATERFFEEIKQAAAAY